jgi:hypothetical protein
VSDPEGEPAKAYIALAEQLIERAQSIEEDAMPEISFDDE